MMNQQVRSVYPQNYVQNNGNYSQVSLQNNTVRNMGQQVNYNNSINRNLTNQQISGNVAYANINGNKNSNLNSNSSQMGIVNSSQMRYNGVNGSLE